MCASEAGLICIWRGITGGPLQGASRCEGLKQLAHISVTSCWGAHFRCSASGPHSLLISPAAPLMDLPWAAHFHLFLNSQVLIFTSRFQVQAEREQGAVCRCSRAEVAGTDALINSARGKQTFVLSGPCVTLWRGGWRGRGEGGAAIDWQERFCLSDSCVCAHSRVCVSDPSLRVEQLKSCS